MNRQEVQEAVAAVLTLQRLIKVNKLTKEFGQLDIDLNDFACSMLKARLNRDLQKE